MPRADIVSEYLVPLTLQLKKFVPDRVAWMACAPKEPTTPSEWFSQKFPDHAKTFGCPFLEMIQPMGEGFNQISPISMNTDFFAAILGGDAKLGHQVVYLQSECQFYFLDVRENLWKPTIEEKLGNLLRALLMRCAEELPQNVHKLNLFLEFRSDKMIRAIVHRAKSILAADDSFFGPESGNVRHGQGPDIYERVARAYVEQVLERQAGEVLTMNDAYVHFCEYLKSKKLPPVKRKEFKGLVAPAIHEQFELGVRNDLRDEAKGEWHSGWKGIRAMDLRTVASN